MRAAIKEFVLWQIILVVIKVLDELSTFIALSLPPKFLIDGHVKQPFESNIMHGWWSVPIAIFGAFLFNYAAYKIREMGFNKYIALAIRLFGAALLAAPVINNVFQIILFLYG